VHPVKKTLFRFRVTLTTTVRPTRHVASAMAKAGFLGLGAGAALSAALYLKLGVNYSYHLSVDLHSLRPAFGLPMVNCTPHDDSTAAADTEDHSAAALFREQWNRPFRFVHESILQLLGTADDENDQSTTKGSQ
jgi:hypothetical protein